VNDDDIRVEILKIAYEVYKNPDLQNIKGGWGKPADFDRIDADAPKVLRAVNYLIEEGYLQLHRISNQRAKSGIEIGITRITVKGVNYIEGRGLLKQVEVTPTLQESKIESDKTKVRVRNPILPISKIAIGIIIAALGTVIGGIILYYLIG
jgi:hypothetical protein